MKTPAFDRIFFCTDKTISPESLKESIGISKKVKVRVMDFRVASQGEITGFAEDAFFVYEEPHAGLRSLFNEEGTDYSYPTTFSERGIHHNYIEGLKSILSFHGMLEAEHEAME